MDIFFFEAFEEEEQALRRHMPAGIDAGFTRHTIQETLPPSAPPPASLISIRTQSVIPPHWAGSLRGILTRSTGFDHVRDYINSTGPGVAGGWLPLYCNRAVAEHALLLWMALLRGLPRQSRQFTGFDRDGITGSEALGKTLLVTGVGNIGHETVKIGHGLGMEVLCCDIIRKYPAENYVDLAHGVATADIIVCAMNLTPANTGLFNYDLLKTAKRTAIFVNIARGEQSPATGLLRLLREKRLGGVGLDVYPSEQELAVSMRTGQASRNPEILAILQLARRDDVILTPHNAFNTRESVERKSEQSIQQLHYFMEHGRFLWPVA